MKLKRYEDGRKYPIEFSLHRGNLFNHFREGNAEAVRSFLQAQLQWLGYYYFGKSLLHKAAEYDYPELLAVLVELGLDVNTPEEEYPWGALNVAVHRGRLCAARWLLEHGAKTTYVFRGLTFSCGTLSTAAFGPFDMLKLLVEHGAPVDTLTDDPPRGLLSTAIQFGQSEIADYLRLKGALTDDEIKRRAKGAAKPRKGKK